MLEVRMKQVIAGMAALTLMCMVTGCGIRSDEARSTGTTVSPAVERTMSAITPMLGAPTLGARTTNEAQEDSMGSSSSNDATVTPSAASQEPKLNSTRQGVDSAGSGSGDAPLVPTVSTKDTTPIGATQWLVYTDPVRPFSMSYPDSYVQLDEPTPLSTIAPNLVQRVRFQDKKLAKGALAQVEPAQFTIEVFDNSAGVSLEQWIDTVIPSGGSRTSAAVGNRSGYQVMLNTLLAPNQFYYVADGTFVYRFTPLGQYSQAMLQSLNFGT
jgi:hypothetical protein